MEEITVPVLPVDEEAESAEDNYIKKHRARGVIPPCKVTIEWPGEFGGYSEVYELHELDITMVREIRRHMGMQREATTLIPNRAINLTLTGTLID